MGRTNVDERAGPGTGPGLGGGLGTGRRSRATPSIASSGDDPSGIAWVDGNAPRPSSFHFFRR